MFKKFNFDYDSENDSLFLFDPKSKSKASIDFDNLLIDFNSKMQVSGIEVLSATKFLSSIAGSNMTKQILKNVKECKVNIISKDNFFVLKLLLLLNTNEQIAAPIMIPMINKPSPAVSY